VKPRLLLRVGCHHQLPANFMGDAMLPAKPDHLPDSRHRKPRLERSRLVVKTRVENAAIVRALVTTRTRFFFQHHNSQTRPRLQQPVSCRQSDNSPANNDDLR